MPAPHAIATLSATIANIYTDGACSGNPGPGGWGVRIEFSDGQVQELGGASGTTTNNRMEMQAAIAALEYIQAWQPAQAQSATPITLHTDSQYVIKGITQWIKGWKRKSWKTAQGKPVLNQDLWQTLDELNLSTIRWQHVKGHAGIPGNERCDAIATGFAAGRLPKLAQVTPRPLAPATASTTATTAQIDKAKIDTAQIDTAQIDTSKKVGPIPDGIDPNTDQNAQKKQESSKLTDNPAIRADRKSVV